MLYKDVRRGFGLAIKNWRGKSGFSQEELAWRASLHRSYLADIERGARNPSLQTIEKLAKALKVSLSTLLQPLDPSQCRAAKTVHRRAAAQIDSRKAGRRQRRR